MPFSLMIISIPEQPRKQLRANGWRVENPTNNKRERKLSLIKKDKNPARKWSDFFFFFSRKCKTPNKKGTIVLNLQTLRYNLA